MFEITNYPSIMNSGTLRYTNLAHRLLRFNLFMTGNSAQINRQALMAAPPLTNK